MNNVKLTEIGRFNKPHGISGEISASVDVDPSTLRCIVVNVDGIDVPFFISSVRPKGRDNMLLKIDGYDTEEAVKMFVNKPIFALAEEVPEAELDADADGFYASDFIGFTALDDDDDDDDASTPLGTIVDIDDNTENVLFIIESADRRSPLYVPVVDEFITDIDVTERTISFSLPEGIKNL